MPAHLSLPKSQLREYASATLMLAGLASAVAYSESVFEPLLNAPDYGVWITQALNECDLHNLFGLHLESKRVALPAADSPLLEADPSLRHVALVSGLP
jgi:hypothetical protein